MSERLPDGVNPDFSVNVNWGERAYLVNRCFDHIHLFRRFGFAILKIVDPNDGFVQMCVAIEDAESIAEVAQIIPIVAGLSLLQLVVMLAVNVKLSERPEPS